MFNGAFFWRVMLAAIGVFFVWIILPLFIELLGLHPPAALLMLIRYCVAAIAIFYVLKG